jgi:hypothetical protein
MNYKRRKPRQHVRGNSWGSGRIGNAAPDTGWHTRGTPRVIYTAHPRRANNGHGRRGWRKDQAA